MNIDVHAHFLPPACADLRDGPGTSVAANERDSMSDLAQRVQDMDERGIDVQLLSVAPGLAHPAPAAARRLNDATAEAIAVYPSRFGALATVPLEDPEEGARELERAVKDLGFRGLEVLTNFRGENLDSPRYAPLFRKMVELDVAALVHPSNVMGRRDRLSAHFLVNLIGNPTDTAVAAASLVFGGVLREMPQLKLVLSHGGGTCPALAGRWDHAWRMGLVADAAIDQPPSDYSPPSDSSHRCRSSAAWWEAPLPSAPDVASRANPSGLDTSSGKGVPWFSSPPPFSSWSCSGTVDGTPGWNRGSLPRFLW